MATEAIPSAVNWVVALLTGGLGQTIAVLTVGGVGFGLLAGRVELRRGAQVVLGCFILFGAPMIVRGLMDAMGDSNGSVPSRQASSTPPLTPPLPPQAPNPYAGASVPMENRPFTAPPNRN